MKIQSRRIVFSITLAAMSIFFYSLHEADTAIADAKRYPSAICISPEQGSSYLQLFSYTYGRIQYNGDYFSGSVVCPLPLDSDTLSSAFVYLWDRNSSENFSCYIYNRSPASLSYYRTTELTTSGTSASPTKYNFSGMPSNLTDQYRTMECYIPRRDSSTSYSSVITSIYVDET